MRLVHQGTRCTLSGLLHLLYSVDICNEVLQLGYGANIYDTNVGCSTFADDIELVTLSPVHLQNIHLVLAKDVVSSCN